MTQNKFKKEIKRYKLIISLAIGLFVIFSFLEKMMLLIKISYAYSSDQTLLDIMGVLLAITFTSYSLLFTVISYLRNSLKRSEVIGEIGKWFLFNIYIEIISVVLGAIVQIKIFHTSLFILSIAVIYTYLSLFSFILIGVLSYYMHFLFDSVRKDNLQSSP
jgi:hypothetical protein